jgi:hypothetical protein
MTRYLIDLRILSLVEAVESRNCQFRHCRECVARAVGELIYFFAVLRHFIDSALVSLLGLSRKSLNPAPFLKSVLPFV